MKTQKNRIRVMVAWQIIALNLLLFFASITYYILRGFTQDELTNLIVLLGSLAAIYIGSSFKFIGMTIKKSADNKEVDSQNLFFSKLILWIVPIHYLLFLTIISCKAFTLITFKEMIIFLGILEVCFGVYMGQVIDTLYKVEKT